MRFKVKNALKEILIMNTNKKILLIIIFLLIMCTGISISYAFFKVASSNNNANTNVTMNGAALCMSLQLSSNNVTLSNEYAVPVSDAKALSSEVYKTEVTIQNNCGDVQSFNLLLVPNSSNTMPIKALKYTLTEEGVTPTSGTLISNEYLLDSTIQKQLLSIKNETLKNGFSVGSGIVNANTSKKFNLYLWIDKDEGSLGNGSTMDKILNAYLTLGSGTTIGELKPDLYHTIENRYNQDKTYLGLYTGEGADTYDNPVYYYKGNVQNNNVLFAGFCWKIVRTTETGGVKIVYNGVQKDFYESTLLNESEYANLNNDATYPYTFDSTNKTWTSTNTETNSSTITFTAPSNGNYVLNYDLSMYSYQNIIYVEIFKDDASQGKFTGITTGQIVFIDLDTTNTIKVVFTRKYSYTSGSRNNVIFSFGKANNIVKTCNNTGTDSQIGTSAFNEEDKSPAYAGYMYNTAYPSSTKEILNYFWTSETIMYADSVTYDTSANNYTLDNSTIASFNNSTSDKGSLVGKYTCKSSSATSTCATVYYVASDDDNGNYFYYPLSNGDIDGTDNGVNYVFGKSFTYTNGTYTLNDTIIINTDQFAVEYSKINNYHYSCLNDGITCESINYIYYYDDIHIPGSIKYITLTEGKSVNDALNEMLYGDDVNKNDSTIKAYIDLWYKENMISYTEKLEDTIFCNDRSISRLGAWNPNGGVILRSDFDNFELYFKNVWFDNQSLMCTNETDRFSMSNSKAKLKYPIGLLSAPELSLAGYGRSHYFNNHGQNVWLISPSSLWGESPSTMHLESSGGVVGNSVTYENGVRPSISLKPGTEFKFGDGSFTSPFVIE